MKLIGLAIALMLNSFAHAAEIDCRDTKTFAYGTASAVDSPSGKITVSFSSSVLSLFADRIAPGSADGYTSASLEFNAADCKSLSNCGGSDVAVTLKSLGGQSAKVIVDTAVVSFSANGLTAEVVKGVMIRADTSVPLNICSQK